MTAVAENDGPSHDNGPTGPRRWAAYRQANYLLAHAGIALRLAGVPPGAPELGAIRLALRAVNEAGGLGLERKEEERANAADEPRADRAVYGRRAG